MRISDWSSDVCSSDLSAAVAVLYAPAGPALGAVPRRRRARGRAAGGAGLSPAVAGGRSTGSPHYGAAMTSLHDLSALEQAAAVRNRETSAADLVEHYAARIGQHDPSVGAFVTLTLDAARAQAAEADRSEGH